MTKGKRPKCLQCGRPLRQHCRTVWEDTDRWPALPETCARTNYEFEACGGRVLSLGEDPANPGRPLGECEDCGIDCSPRSPIRRVVSRAPYRRQYGSEPGDYGDGFFCGLRCGMAFAVAAARAGVRLKKSDGG